MNVITRFWKTLSVVTLVIGIFFLPKDVQELGAAAEPWQRTLALLDQNTALWLVSIGFGLWIIWTDLRPFVRERWKRFPPQHAQILQQITDHLSKAEQVATRRQNALNPFDSEARLRALNAYHSERMKTELLSNQIAYDVPTVQTIRDYLQLCSIIMDDEFVGHDNREDRATLDQLRGPVFHALHSGKSINRRALPLPNWMRAEDGISQERLNKLLRSLEGK